jgi:hypothetical protein
MFVLTKFKYTAKIPASEFGKDFVNTLTDRINADFANFVSPQLLICNFFTFRLLLTSAYASHSMTSRKSVTPFSCLAIPTALLLLNFDTLSSNRSVAKLSKAQLQVVARKVFG